jgi:hypothetical protein
MVYQQSMQHLQVRMVRSNSSNTGGLPTPNWRDILASLMTTRFITWMMALMEINHTQRS